MSSEAVLGNVFQVEDKVGQRSYSGSRLEVVERDKCCFLCMVERNEISRIEEVHHVVPRSAWGREQSEKHEVRNLIGVCHKCHAGHSPHIQSYEMICYILRKLHDIYGYNYYDRYYMQYVEEIYEERDDRELR